MGAGKKVSELRGRIDGCVTLSGRLEAPMQLCTFAKGSPRHASKLFFARATCDEICVFHHRRCFYGFFCNCKLLTKRFFFGIRQHQSSDKLRYY